MKKFPFQNPDEKYRGLDLYMVNDALDDEEIRKQIFEFKEKGFYSVIFRTYNGLISDYPGPQFKSKVRTAIEASKACGLKLALQAGYMPSAYPDLPREYALHRIIPVMREEVTEEDTVIATHGDIAFLDKIAPATVNMISPEAVDFYIRTAYEENWAEFEEEYGKTVISIWLDEPRFDNRTLTWSPCFEEEFTARFGYSIKENLASLYFDEGDYKRVRYDYFTFLREQMEVCYYAKVREWCHAHNLSFAGHLMGEERLTMQATQSVASMPFYQYFDVPGIDMLASVHDWYDKPVIPFTAEHGRFVERSLHIPVLQLISSAEQSGKDLKLCEMYGVTSPSFVFRDQMHLFDFFAANGVNHQCVHAMFYSPKGFRKRFYPQSFNRYMPFWENFRNVKDYVASASSFVSMGQSCTEICVLHPIETVYGLLRGLINTKDESPRAEAEDYDARYYRLLVQLYSTQTAFHFVAPSMLDALGEALENRLKVGCKDYAAIVIADIEVITAKTLALLKEFAKKGGKIYFKGMLPSRLDGVYCESLRDDLAALPSARVLQTNEELIRALREIDVGYRYACEGNSSRIVINHRREAGEHYFFIHNGDCREEKKGTLSLKGEHSAFLFEPYSHKIEELSVRYRNGITEIPVKNAVGASVMLLTKPLRSQKEKESDAYLNIPAENVACALEAPNALTLEICTYKTEKMTDLTDKPIAIERVTEKLKAEDYRGEVTLRFSFESSFEAKNLSLVIEDAHECRVTLNGIEASTEVVGHYANTAAFEIIRLPDAVKVGQNRIEVTRYTEPPLATKTSDDMKHLFELFRKPEGVDLERIHVLGDFSVDAVPEYSQAAGCVRFGKNFMITPKKKPEHGEDITSEGYPFYAAPINYQALFLLTESMLHCRRVLLRIGRYHGCSATVSISGQKIGCIDRDPYTLEIDPSLLHEGENEISLKLLGTFRNMFGPSHVLDYDTSFCSRLTWHRDFEHTDCTEYDKGGLTNSFQLIPYGIGDISLQFYM